MRAPLAKARAEASTSWGGVQYAPATAPITRALEATKPKRRTLSTAHPVFFASEVSEGGLARTRGAAPSQRGEGALPPLTRASISPCEEDRDPVSTTLCELRRIHLPRTSVNKPVGCCA